MKNGFDFALIPTVSAGAYSAGDVVGGLLTFPVGEKGDGRIPIVDSALVTLKAAIASTMTLHLFNAAPAVIADNGAFTIGTVADVQKFLGSWTFGSALNLGTPKAYMSVAIGLPMLPADGQNLYGYLVDGTGFTPTSTSDVQIRLRGHF